LSINLKKKKRLKAKNGRGRKLKGRTSKESCKPCSKYISYEKIKASRTCLLDDDRFEAVILVLQATGLIKIKVRKFINDKGECEQKILIKPLAENVFQKLGVPVDSVP